MAFAGLQCQDFLDSWGAVEGMYPLSDVLAWVDQRNATVEVSIEKVPFERCEGWYYDSDEGAIRNERGTFFKVTGIEGTDGSGQKVAQPILLQAEIGFLGMLCKKIDGVLHFLMQAKIEPGNVNAVQLSPTIQATKSNFTRQHQGKAPAYLDYFLDADPGRIVVDTLQSEQSSRFLGKRNRNIIVMAEGEVEVLPSHRWMTLGQIAHCMRIDNLVNMDTRTVLSCVPYSRMPQGSSPVGARLVSAGRGVDWERYERVVQALNNAKMFHEGSPRLVALDSLADWEMRDGAIACRHDYPFQVVFCDISIEGREVRHWHQPLFEAMGKATFGLLARRRGDGLLEFLVKEIPEIGSRDVLELGPTVQREVFSSAPCDGVEELFNELAAGGEAVLLDCLQSEEGGRFYHEQNRNIIVLLPEGRDVPPCSGYHWCDFMTLSELCQERFVNIQLRSLISLMGVLMPSD